MLIFHLAAFSLAAPVYNIWAHSKPPLIGQWALRFHSEAFFFLIIGAI